MTAQEICTVQTKESIVEDCWLAFCSQALEKNRLQINKQSHTHTHSHSNLTGREKWLRDGKGGTELNDFFSSDLKLLKSLWTVACLDVSSVCAASARCCSEIRHPQVLEEIKVQPCLFSQDVNFTPYGSNCFFPLSIFLLCDNQV